MLSTLAEQVSPNTSSAILASLSQLSERQRYKYSLAVSNLPPTPASLLQILFSLHIASSLYYPTWILRYVTSGILLPTPSTSPFPEQSLHSLADRQLGL